MVVQTELIRGKIAKILSTREVALNKGKEHGVEPGMLFEILYATGLGIEDPDTGEALGSVDVPKARVKVTQVYDKLSVAGTYRTKSVNVGGVGVDPSSYAKLFQPPKWERRYETLKTRESTKHSAEDLGEEDSYVTIGDAVVQVLDEEQA